MVRVLAVLQKNSGEVIEYAVLQRGDYTSADALLNAVRDESARLCSRYGLPHPERELFEGGARTVEGFFRMFPNIQLTPAHCARRSKHPHDPDHPRPPPGHRRKPGARSPRAAAAGDPGG